MAFCSMLLKAIQRVHVFIDIVTNIKKYHDL